MLALDHGGPECAPSRIEADLEKLSGTLALALGPELEAVLLLGGYARGEGGLVEHEGRLVPFNDYDVVVVLDWVRPRLRRRLALLRGELEQAFGVEVDLHPIERRRLDPPPRTLLWLDAALGAVRVLHGNPEILAAVRRLTARSIPLAECGRLLANRATGLALSNLEAEPERGGRAARHAHKAVLACGDVLLLAADRYEATARARLAQLESLAGAPAVTPALLSAYRDALRFRERPDRWRPEAEDFRGWYTRICQAVAGWHLAFEAWRVGTPRSVAGFATFPGRLYRDADDLRPALAGIAHLRSCLRGNSPWRPYLGHPRERLARAAVALAYGSGESACREAAARLLGLRDPSDATLRARLAGLVAEAA